METRIFQSFELEEAARLLKKGEVVSFPTETVYGLGADATNEEAVRKVFAAKGRPSDNPLIVHVSSIEEVQEHVDVVPVNARQLMETFWPGPLTIIFNARDGVFAPTATAGLNSVAIRMPNNQLTLELIRRAETPLVGPSANTSGKPSPTSADHVYHDLNGKIAGILDDGETGVGLESTVLDMTDPQNPTILRPGGISKADLETFIPDVKLDQHLVSEKERPKAPGMKYQHYAPAEPVVIVEDEDHQWEAAIRYFIKRGEKVGLLANSLRVEHFRDQATAIFSLGNKQDAREAAKYLYAGLRYFEKTEATVILAEAYKPDGIGEAYMNRLEKAAGNRYFKNFLKK